MPQFKVTTDDVKAFLPDRSNGHSSAIPSEKRLGSANSNLITGLPSVPVTFERQPYHAGANDVLQHPGTARANIAPSKESPRGTEVTSPQYLAPFHVQRYLLTFDLSPRRAGPRTTSIKQCYSNIVNTLTRTAMESSGPSTPTAHVAAGVGTLFSPPLS